MVRSKTKVHRYHPIEFAFLSIRSRFQSTFQSALYVQLVAVLTSLGIFVLDILSHAHASIGVMYVTSLALLINQPRKVIFTFAIASSALLVIDLAVFFSPGLHYTVLMDKVIGLMAIWVSSWGILRYKELREKSERRKMRHIEAVEHLLFLTSHKVRKPVCSIRGLAQMLDRTATPEEIDQILRHIRSSAQELDGYTEDLTRFIYNESRKN